MFSSSQVSLANLVELNFGTFLKRMKLRISNSKKNEQEIEFLYINYI